MTWPPPSPTSPTRLQTHTVLQYRTVQYNIQHARAKHLPPTPTSTTLTQESEHECCTAQMNNVSGATHKARITCETALSKKSTKPQPRPAKPPRQTRPLRQTKTRGAKPPGSEQFHNPPTKAKPKHFAKETLEQLGPKPGKRRQDLESCSADVLVRMGTKNIVT